jgi:hypothetical protein
MDNMDIKLGHQAPSGLRLNRFNYVGLSDTNLKYCDSHNFVFDSEEENRKLHNGEACFYTDRRYSEYSGDSYKELRLYSGRFSPISLKSCIRRVRRCKNIPVGTVMEFDCSWYYVHAKHQNKYLFKIREDVKFDPGYEVNKPSFYANFSTDERAAELVGKLRENGFLVSVVNGDKEYAVAYGYGKRAGITSHDNSFLSAHSTGSVLWDWNEEFNKWSQCNEIPKDTPIDEIVLTLMQ